MVNIVVVPLWKEGAGHHPAPGHRHREVCRDYFMCFPKYHDLTPPLSESEKTKGQSNETELLLLFILSYFIHFIMSYYKIYESSTI